MESGADLADDVAIDVASDVPGDISTAAHLWMGPILRGPLSWPNFNSTLITNKQDSALYTSHIKNSPQNQFQN